MSGNSPIEWTHHTFNPWWGCQEVGPGCDHCYARTLAQRLQPRLPLWGPGSSRLVFDGSNKKQHWREPFRWNKRAARAGVRERVFCASMADVFDNHSAVVEARQELWATIRLTPHLDWLLLTKRVSNIAKMLPPGWGAGYPNVWLGISIVNQAEADRDIPRLLAIPAAVRFLSCEPLLGPIELTRLVVGSAASSLVGGIDTINIVIDSLRGAESLKWRGLDWIIVGGESGQGARSMNVQWAGDILAQCRTAGVAAFMKQLGAKPVCWDGQPYPLIFDRTKGGHPDDWHPALRVREFPA